MRTLSSGHGWLTHEPALALVKFRDKVRKRKLSIFVMYCATSNISKHQSICIATCHAQQVSFGGRSPAGLTQGAWQRRSQQGAFWTPERTSQFRPDAPAERARWKPWRRGCCGRFWLRCRTTQQTTAATSAAGCAHLGGVRARVSSVAQGNPPSMAWLTAAI